MGQATCEAARRASKEIAPCLGIVYTSIITVNSPRCGPESPWAHDLCHPYIRVAFLAAYARLIMDE